MRSYDELLQISGYARRPRDFDTLLAILGTELRLITPTDPRGSDPGEVDRPAEPARRYYHLTHDYLVPPLRQWLTQQRETRRGRVEVLLSNLTTFWSDRPERRRLPSTLEWLAILWYIRPKSWTDADRRMMNAATQHYLAARRRSPGTGGRAGCHWRFHPPAGTGLVTPRTLAQGRFPEHSRASTPARFPSRQFAARHLNGSRPAQRPLPAIARSRNSCSSATDQPRHALPSCAASSRTRAPTS